MTVFKYSIAYSSCCELCVKLIVEANVAYIKSS